MGMERWSPMVAQRLNQGPLLRSDPTPADNGNDVLTMTPEEAFKRRQRRWRVTLATLIVVLATLAAWVVEQITRVQ
jgi:hypothetical protein